MLLMAVMPLACNGGCCVVGRRFREQTGTFVSFHLRKRKKKAERAMLSSYLKAALSQLHYAMIPELFFDKVYNILEENTKLYLY